MESVRAIHKAIDLGVKFLYTADACGTGHSEEVLGRALGHTKGIKPTDKFRRTLSAA